MVKELSYNTISLVIESWEKLRRKKNYEVLAGTLLFQRLFDKCPQAKVLFGFPLNIDPYSKEVYESKRFVMHASYLLQMLDTALNMLGPDIELLTEIMLELGSKHVRYGVKTEMFSVMGDSLIYVLENTIGEHMTPTVKQAWIETYEELSKDMMEGFSLKSAR